MGKVIQVEFGVGLVIGDVIQIPEQPAWWKVVEINGEEYGIVPCDEVGNLL